ncbi:MAG: DUF6265 family protein [Saprospiraceae bacterium]
MKRTISRLFQENQHKLTQAPPPSAWRKLERRLDTHRPGKWAIFRQVAAVAAVLLIIALFSLVATYMERVEKQTAMAQVEELQINEQDSETLRALEYARQFSSQLGKAIEEGDLSKRLTLALPAAEKQLKVSVSDFKWLEGEWRSNSNGQQSVEIWKRRNAQMLEGTGLMLVKGDTVFAEQLRIYNTGTKFYFETTLVKGQAPVRYALKHFFADRIVFENTEIDFPQQVVLEIHSPNVYSIILKNEAAVGLSDSELSYLNQRNKIVNQHIIRVMERSEYQ